MVNFLQIGKKEIPKKEEKPKKIKKDYGFLDDGTKIWEKCKKPFTPNKFTPYQKMCIACGKGGENAPKTQKSSGGGMIRTQCNKCGCNIRIDPTIMTAFCNDHCPPEERKKRIEDIQNRIEASLNNKAESKLYPNEMPEYKILYSMMESEVEEYKNVMLDKFSNGDLSEFPFSRELLYFILLARGFKLSKSGHIFKEYISDDGIYTASMVSPNMGFFGFCVTHPVKEKYGKGVVSRRESIILRTPNFKKIPNIPSELTEDIFPILELNASKLAERGLKDEQ
jgi:hypothetical protein